MKKLTMITLMAVLTAASALPVFAVLPNDTCAGAIDIQAAGLTEWDVDACDATGDYNPFGAASCTGYRAAGKDVVYRITLAAGETFMATQSRSGQSTAVDMSLYLVTDCANIVGSCVAGSDNYGNGVAEAVSYVSAGGGTYYLIVDAYNLNVCSVYHIAINAPVPAESSTWGAVKAYYR